MLEDYFENVKDRMMEVEGTVVLKDEKKEMVINKEKKCFIIKFNKAKYAKDI